MLKKFVVWFVCFGLSFLFESFGWAEQGKAFFFIDVGVEFFLILVLLAIIKTGGSMYGYNNEAIVASLLIVFITIGVLAVIMVATWVATKLFDVDFYVAYQIMTFGQCLCTNNKKKDD